MGFNLETQRAYTLPGGGRGEAGRLDFSAASYCQAVATTMVDIYAWHASPGIDVSSPGASRDLNSTELNLTVDIGDITNGNIIVKRQTSRSDVSASWYYEVKGW